MKKTKNRIRNKHAYATSKVNYFIDFLRPVSTQGHLRTNHTHSYWTPGRNASHQNTNKKLIHSSTYNTINGNHNQVIFFISFIYNWERFFQTESLRRTQNEIKTQLIKVQTCLIWYCNDAQ